MNFATARVESLRVCINTHPDEEHAAGVGRSLQDIAGVCVEEVQPDGPRIPEGGANMQHIYSLLNDPSFSLRPGQGGDAMVVQNQLLRADQIVRSNRGHGVVWDTHSPIDTVMAEGFVFLDQRALRNPRILRAINALAELGVRDIIFVNFGMYPYSRDSAGNLNSMGVDLNPANKDHQPDKVHEATLALMNDDDHSGRAPFDPMDFRWLGSYCDITREQAERFRLGDQQVNPGDILPVGLAHELGCGQLIAVSVPIISTDDPKRAFWGEAAAPLAVHDILGLLPSPT